MEKEPTKKDGLIKEFFTCPSCGRAICGSKKRYFTCPSCGRALCEENKLDEFDDNYCGNCGAEVASAKEQALAERNQVETGQPQKKKVMKYKDGRPVFVEEEI